MLIDLDSLQIDVETVNVFTEENLDDLVQFVIHKATLRMLFALEQISGGHTGEPPSIIGSRNNVPDQVGDDVGWQVFPQVPPYLPHFILSEPGPINELRDELDCGLGSTIVQGADFLPGTRWKHWVLVNEIHGVSLQDWIVRCKRVQDFIKTGLVGIEDQQHRKFHKGKKETIS